MRVATLSFSVVYDESVTNADSIAEALDILLATALSTDGVLDECGNPDVGEIEVEMDVNAEVAGRAC